MKVKNLNNLVEQLKPKLKEYLELKGTKFNRTHFQCPNRRWHSNNDDKPACAFYPDENHFHCFVCNVSGDIFNAINLLEGLAIEGSEFIRTVIKLAELFKMRVDIEEDDTDKYNRKLREMLKLIKDVSHKTYLETKEVREYIAKRGLSNIEKKVNFGYCKYEMLKKFLLSKGYTEKNIEDVGVFKELLNERLIIPIYDEYGRLSGFGSRQIKDDKYEKYYNPATSVLYKKSHTLYNFNVAKRAETVLVVEGFIDALTLMSKGIINVVALCGSFISDKHIRLLVKYGIKKIVLCLDNDSGGKEALKNAINSLMQIKEITTKVIELKDAKDPDEFIIKYGIGKFKELHQINVFDYKLKKYIESGLEKENKDELLQFILDEKSFIEKERMCKTLAKIMKVRIEAVIKELENLEKEKEGDYAVTTADIVNEKDSLLKEIFIFEKWAQNRGKLLGLNILYPTMTEKLDGLQSGFYIIAGEENTGKSALTLSLAVNLIEANPRKVFILYFGLDSQNRTLVARMLAGKTGIPINTVSNPNYKILNNPEIENPDEVLKKRDGGLDYINSLTDSLSIKDTTTVKSLEDMERIIKVYKNLIDEERQLVVIVDSLNKIKTMVKKETRAIYMHISDTLQEWAIKFDIPVLAISELRKLTHSGMRPTNDDIKEAGDFKYDTDVTMLIYNELHSRRESDERVFVGENGIVYPVIELIFFKNKLSGFKGTLYYKFYTDICRMEECSLEEMKKYWEV